MASRGALLAYAGPALALSIIGLPLSVQLPTFWAVDMHLGLAGVGFVLSAGRLFDVVSDPLIGRLSDGWHSRFGRRKPFILIGLPVAVVGAVGVFFPSSGAGLVHLLVFNTLLMLGWSLIALPYQAMGAELSSDYAERTRITGWRETLTLLGVLTSAIIPAVFGVNDPGMTLDILALVTFGLAAPTIAALLLLVRENDVRRQPTVGWRRAIRTIAANRPFRRLLVAWLINGVANGLPATLFLLLVGRLLDAPDAVGPLLLAYFLAALAGIPLWSWLARLVGKHRSWAWAMMWSCACFAFVPTLGPHDVWEFLLICVGSGSGLGADLALPPAMQADVVDLDEADSGEQRAGQFFAAWTMAQKGGNALAAGVAFPLLGLAGFNTEGANSGRAMATLVGLYCIVPILLKLIAVALVWGFPIDAAEQRRLRAAIAARQ
jgi:Na+/melibiose symporter-like transporter